VSHQKEILIFGGFDILGFLTPDFETFRSSGPTFLLCTITNLVKKLKIDKKKNRKNKQGKNFQRNRHFSIAAGTLFQTEPSPSVFCIWTVQHKKGSKSYSIL